MERTAVAWGVGKSLGGCGSPGGFYPAQLAGTKESNSCFPEFYKLINNLF